MRGFEISLPLANEERKVLLKRSDQLLFEPALAAGMVALNTRDAELMQ